MSTTASSKYSKYGAEQNNDKMNRQGKKLLNDSNTGCHYEKRSVILDMIPINKKRYLYYVIKGEIEKSDITAILLFQIF